MDTLFLKNKAKIIRLEGDFLDKYEMFKNVDSFSYDLGLKVSHYEEEAKETKALASSLKDHMSLLKEKMSLLFELVKALKVEYIKAYRSKVSFVISNPKMQVDKLNLIVPYYTLMRTFQSSRGKVFPGNILVPSPHSEETTQRGHIEG